MDLSALICSEGIFHCDYNNDLICSRSRSFGVFDGPSLLSVGAVIILSSTVKIFLRPSMCCAEAMLRTQMQRTGLSHAGKQHLILTKIIITSQSQGSLHLLSLQ